MIGYIYQLVCPVKNEPIYVGSTKHPLKVRLSGHISSSRLGTTTINKYIREQAIIPSIELIEEMEISSSDELREAEYRWANLLKQQYPLLNVILKKSSSKSTKVTIKIEESVLEQVRMVVSATRQRIGGFIELAIEEKLKKSK